MPDKQLFGTDGVRGFVGKEPITPLTIMKLGWAAGTVLRQESGHNKVVIGKDTRVSGYMLESALEAGFAAAGVNVSMIGPMPTPGIAYLTRTARAIAGVVISASHNPYHDNGIKFFDGKGRKLPDEVTKAINDLMAEEMSCVTSRKLGKAERFSDARGRYIEFCKSTFLEGHSLAGIHLVVDCANGAAYDIAPHLFEELGATVEVIGNQPDGYNINQGCGSTDLKALRDKVLESGADLGIAVDGDADRVLMVDHQGNTVNGDQLLYILAMDRKQRQREGGVVGTVMTNYGFELAMAAENIPFVRTPVGDRFVHEAMVKNQWLLGGENSGHIICLNKTSTGDGLIAALQVLSVVMSTGRSIHDLVKDLEIYPQLMINVPLQPGNSAMQLCNDDAVTDSVKEAEKQLDGRGRIVLRPSGTEPLVRVMVEGEDNDQVEQLAVAIAEVIKQQMK